jgi:hypothetical protein
VSHVATLWLRPPDIVRLRPAVGVAVHPNFAALLLLVIVQRLLRPRLPRSISCGAFRSLLLGRRV